MARVSADLGSADLGEFTGDCSVDEFDPARAAASAGVMGEEGSVGDKSSSEIRIDRLFDELPPLQIACQKEALVPSGMKTRLPLSSGAVGRRLHHLGK
jgi:hypothetical protein